jgi:iron complex outermembrane recepter protein
MRADNVNVLLNVHGGYDRSDVELIFGFLGEYTDAKLTADAPGLGALSGDKLPYVPDVSATVNADYRWHAFGKLSGFAGASWHYNGNSYTSFSPSAGVVESHAKLPDYNTLKLNAGLDDGQYSAEIYATNVTNRRGISEYLNSGGVNQTGLANFIQPRTIGVQVGVKF